MRTTTQTRSKIAIKAKTTRQQDEESFINFMHDSQTMKLTVANDIARLNAFMRMKGQWLTATHAN